MITVLLHGGALSLVAVRVLRGDRDLATAASLAAVPLLAHFLLFPQSLGHVRNPKTKYQVPHLEMPLSESSVEERGLQLQTQVDIRIQDGIGLTLQSAAE